MIFYDSYRNQWFNGSPWLKLAHKKQVIKVVAFLSYVYIGCAAAIETQFDDACDMPVREAMSASTIIDHYQP